MNRGGTEHLLLVLLPHLHSCFKRLKVHLCLPKAMHTAQTLFRTHASRRDTDVSFATVTNLNASSVEPVQHR